MRWEDEHYVKLYTRETPTFRSWCWQAKALHPLLMKVVDKAGLLECGDMGRGAVALMVGLPEDVALAGLKDLERTGTVEWHGQVLLLPKFEEAQEARKSDAQSKRDQRQRAKDKARAEALKIPQHLSDGVRPRPTESEGVRLQPDPDPVPSPVTTTRAKKPREAEPEDPTWKTLVAALFAKFKAKRGTDPAPHGKDWTALKRLRERVKRADSEIVVRWERGLDGQFKQRVDCFFDLDQRWDSLTSTGPPARAAGGRVTEADKQWDGYEPKKTADGQVDWEAA